jgi:hypothetical protein
MKKLLVVACVFVLSLAISGMAGAAVVSFDDLNGTLKPIPDGYEGYHWNNFSYLKANKLTNWGYYAGMVSSQNVAYNSLALDASVKADAPFTFSGTYLTGAWNDGLHVVVTGYISGMLVGSDDFVTSAYTPTWYAPSWTCTVDTLTFHSYGGVKAADYFVGSGTHFAMDNFNQVPVPLLPSILFLAPGLLGIGILRQRRNGR